jgi:hypothetical protein
LLALQLGMTVSELTERLTSAEEAHWIALYRRDPWGEQRGDLRNALLAQLFHNANSKKPKKMEDFLLFGGKRKEAVGDSPDQIRKNFERLMARQRK